MKMLVYLFFMTNLLSAEARSLFLVHYNIQELDSVKLRHGLESAQLKSVAGILGRYDFDLCSIQEIQYDLPGVPGPLYQSTGENLRLLAGALNRPDFKTTFFPANTGLQAKKQSDGTFATDPNSSLGRQLSDQVNFGSFPAQYSSGALSRYKTKKVVEIHALKWKEFNPGVDLSKFKKADGSPLPEDMALFDKNFTHVVLDVDGQDLHMILLHAVPAHHFGNIYSPNFQRNADQLRFLEWYVTGKTDIDVKLEIIPLESDALALAVGDFNVGLAPLDPRQTGATVLNRLSTRWKMWTPNPDYTNDGDGVRVNPTRLQLDYVFFSPAIKVIEGGIYHPTPQFIFPASPEEVAPLGTSEIQVDVNGKMQRAFVNKDYLEAKAASDHFPIWARFELPAKKAKKK